MIIAISQAPARALLTLAATLGGLAAAAGPAAAAPGRATYVAALSTPLTEARAEIVDGVMWRCAGDTCRGAVNGSRALTACARVARKFGPVARFVTAEGDLPSEELSRCNGRK